MINEENIKVPFPPRISIHPWSMDFISRWEKVLGKVRIFCEVKGVRNHIVIIALEDLIGVCR